MTANYVLLEKITVGAAGASSVTFSGIPQTGYTDLKVAVSARTDASATRTTVNFAFNGSTSNRATMSLFGSDSNTTPVSTTYTDFRTIVPALNSTSNTFSNNEIYVTNYTSSNYKSFSSGSMAANNNSTSRLVGFFDGLWSDTAAITSITFTPAAGSFVQYSTFYLYGVAKLGTTPAIVPYATGGDTIMTDGTYWYHAFKSSGTFTPAKAITCDILAVAGGGGGGYTVADFYSAAGGGAGGVVNLSSQSLITTGYSVTVGAGGAGGTVSNGTNGSNSQFASLTAAVGGGAGSGASGGTAPSGGSGGGSVQLGAVGTGTAGQGNNGGQGNQGGGGGGGAGAVGGSGATPQGLGRPGGAGTNTYSTWLNTTGTGVSGYIAGGGGGGYTTYYLSAGDIVANGGSGGGGTGGGDISGTKARAVGAGTANTGGGGGGAGGYSSPGFSGSAAGGSGLVIVRYAI